MTARPASVAPPLAESRARRLAFLRSARVYRYGLLLPALVYLAVMTQAPFLLTLWYSFHNWILTSPELGHRWIGLDNFRYELTGDPIFRTAIYNTLEITAAIVGGSLVLGLGFALLLNRRFPLRGVARALMMAPFMMLILLAGLQGIPDEIREAARVDGAGPIAEFRRITLPLLGPYVELAVLLGLIYILQLFGEIFVATQGGPGTETTTIPYYVYQTISQANDVGTSSAQGVLAIVFSAIIAALLLRLLTRAFRRGLTA